MKTTHCATHLEFPEIVEEVREVRACIAANGTIGILLMCTAKLRCPDCGSIELVTEPAQHFTVDDFHVFHDGLRAIAKKHGVKLEGA